MGQTCVRCVLVEALKQWLISPAKKKPADWKTLTAVSNSKHGNNKIIKYIMMNIKGIPFVPDDKLYLIGEWADFFSLSIADY